jgi:polyhydroxybutyrate depolymerase
MQAGGVERAYELVVPKSYDGTKPYAVVFGLHALTVSYKFIPSMVGFELADRYHFIGVAPSGRLNGTTPFWMAAPTPDNYDVQFIGALLDRLEATMCIDPSHVFSTGMSNGAQMSSLLACRMPDRITAIAPVSGEEFLAPCDGAPVPIMAFHGSVDPILPYAGGGLNATTIAAQNYWKGAVPAGMPAPLGIDASMQRWARHNHCDAKYVETRVAPHVRRRTWQHCDAATILYVEDGAGHNWPGKRFPQFEAQFGPGTTEIDATALMFKFFFDGPDPVESAGATATTASLRSFCARFTALMSIVEQVPADGRPNIAAATQLVALQQQLVDSAPDAASKDAAAHAADVALANAGGRPPTPQEQAASSNAVAQLHGRCAAGS